MANELDKVIKIGEEDYNINAVNASTADALNSKLTLKRVNLTDKLESVVTEFNGADDKTVLIVPASGGRFSGRITVRSASSDIWTSDGETVLNYNDIVNTVLTQLKKTSVLYTWDGKLNGVTPDAATIQSISVITGPDDQKNALAQHIYDEKPIAAYIYISNDDGNRGKIYFGTSESNTVNGVEVSAENAITATKLANRRTFSVNLANANTATFDGSANVALGVTGTLPFIKGGLGGDISDSNSPAAKAAEYYINGSIDEGTAPVTDDTWMLFKRSAPSATVGQYVRKKAGTLWTYIAGKIRDVFGFNASNILTTTSGGTGQSSLAAVTVGKSDAVKVSYKASTAATAINKYPSITIAPSASYPSGPTGGSEGDIMILF